MSNPFEEYGNSIEQWPGGDVRRSPDGSISWVDVEIELDDGSAFDAWCDENAGSDTTGLVFTITGIEQASEGILAYTRHGTP